MSKPLFAGLLEAFARAVGAGPKKRVVLLLDNAGWHTLPNLAVPDGIRLVYLPPYSPELQPAETLWTLVDEPIVNTLVPNLDKLIDTIGERCSNLTKRQARSARAPTSPGGPKTTLRPNLADLVLADAPFQWVGVTESGHSKHHRPFLSGGGAASSSLQPRSR